MSQFGQFNTFLGVVATLTGNNPGAVGPTLGNINIIGTAGITVTGFPGLSTLQISNSGIVAEQFHTDDLNFAIPIANVLEVNGSTNINTTSVTNHVVVHLNDSIILPNTNNTGTAGMYSLGVSRFMHNYGTHNTWLGSLAGNLSLTVATAINNTGIGYDALGLITVGHDNVAIGNTTGSSLHTGSYNTFVGSSAALSANLSTECTALGALALNASTGDQGITAIGTYALQIANGFTNAVAVGFQSQNSITTGSHNTSCGYQSLTAIDTGSYNTVYGDGAGSSLTLADSSNIMIGNPGTAGDNNKVKIGVQGAGAGQQSSCLIAGIYGSTVTAATSSVVMADSIGNLGYIPQGTNGQLLIGSTGAQPVWDLPTSTVGGIVIAPGAGTLNFEVQGGGVAWAEYTAAAVPLISGNGYIMNRGTLITATLPVAAAMGTFISIVGKGAGLYTIVENAGQIIHFNDQDTTVTTGSLTATNRYDCIELICIVADTEWIVRTSVGNFTVA